MKAEAPMGPKLKYVPASQVLELKEALKLKNEKQMVSHGIGPGDD
jgi:hypothetical protein